MSRAAGFGVLAAGMVATAASLSPSADAAAPTTGAAQVRAMSAATSSADAIARQLNLSGDEALQPMNVYVDRDGTRYTHYNRTFRGLRVIGGDLIVTTAPNGTVRQAKKNGTGKVAVASTTPKLAKSTALAKGRGASKAASVSAVSGTLVVYAGSGQPRLAYEVVTTGVKADQTPSRLLTYVDAASGAVLASNEQIADGTGKGIYVGQVTIGTSGSAGAYKMVDARSNSVADMQNRTGGKGTILTDPDDVWGNGTNSDRASAGVDAQYGAETTYDYYDKVQGRAGIWGTGKGAPSRVHYGNNYANAFWDGTQMTYGDGANNANPLVELDVAGHEMSHGVTENTAGLVYSGDPGGLNEATSDIFGTAVEWYANNPNDVPDYLIGEEINLNGNGTPLRYMDKPSKDGRSYDCWSPAVASANPHYSSGPLNHWFYLASEGSGAKTINGVNYNSPTCNGAAVTGAGRSVAEKVWFRTLSTKLTSNSTYLDAREGAITSAKELYGVGSTQCVAVENAFNAISVPKGTATCSA
ncbi:M4 family metallopeptidase [Calidifontibacter sp. DB0510]|uniref:Neutral metalloproteinase n=1 Tax=Metallococcus carri TaxID=1656884 RepID=A0A967E8V9_9MICO|nr:M4 family metallopeptidase [Metallococcus carri]NHN54585.1 M4 family metallopeptidase [Metallococcus carri]NOP36576.1 M4 family metallopeptidase [Calidifontibacter sp. DB2511S]